MSTYTSIPFRYQLSEQGAKKLREFIPLSLHNKIYGMNVRPDQPYEQCYWKMPSLDGVNHPVFVGRNNKGEWFLLTTEPDELPIQWTYNTGVMMVGPYHDVYSTLKDLAFTIVACGLNEYKDFDVPGSNNQHLTPSLQPHVDNELASLSDARAALFTDIEDPMWAVPPATSIKKNPANFINPNEELNWTSFPDGKKLSIMRRTGEGYKSFIANHGRIKDNTPQFTIATSSNFLYPYALSKLVLRILISGYVHPIKDGYIFVWCMPSYKDVIFVSEDDPRLEAIKAMRLKNLEIMLEHMDSAIRIVEGIANTPFSIAVSIDSEE